MSLYMELKKWFWDKDSNCDPIHFYELLERVRSQEKELKRLKK